MSLTDHAETLILGWLTGASVTRPTARYVAAGSAIGDTFTELASSNGYARSVVTISVSGGVATLGSCQLGPATGAGWSSATHIAVCDASSGGNVLAILALAVARTVTAGNVLDLTGAACTITWGGAMSDAYRTHSLQYLFTTTSLTQPQNWIALGTAATSAGITEETSSGYARKALAMTVSGDQASNSGAVLLGPASADWDDLTHAAIMDAETTGTAIFIAALTGAPLDVANGISARVAVAGARVTQT
jgi:hypothetical protein